MLKSSHQAKLYQRFCKQHEPGWRVPFSRRRDWFLADQLQSNHQLPFARSQTLISTPKSFRRITFRQNHFQTKCFHESLDFRSKLIIQHMKFCQQFWLVIDHYTTYLDHIYLIWFISRLLASIQLMGHQLYQFLFVVHRSFHLEELGVDWSYHFQFFQWLL